MSFVYITLICSLLLFNHLSLSAQKNAPLTLTQNTQTKKIKKTTLMPDNKTVVGEAEYIRIQPGNTVVKARIDTGAKDTSIGAYDIQAFERDGKKWVKFSLPDDEGNRISISQKVVGKTLIKQHGKGAAVKRYEVEMTIILGDHAQTIKVNLADREKYEYPALVGRNFLTGNFIIDPSKKYFQGLPKK